MFLILRKQSLNFQPFLDSRLKTAPEKVATTDGFGGDRFFEERTLTLPSLNGQFLKKQRRVAALG
jgi:hypothetical protein